MGLPGEQSNHEKRATAAGLALMALAWFAPGALADDAALKPAPPNDGVVKEIMKKAGLATDPGSPPDFVVNSRPTDDPDYVPVGRKAFDHKNKAKTPAELKAMEAEFDAVQTRHNALRSTFPPAVKAVAAAEAAKAAKAAKPKKPAPAAKPQ